MKQSIVVMLDEDKIFALELALKKENTSVQQYLGKTLEELYEKNVEAPVREFIARKAAYRSKHPSRAAGSTHTASAKPSAGGSAVGAAVGAAENAAKTSALAAAAGTAKGTAKEAHHE